MRRGPAPTPRSRARLHGPAVVAGRARAPARVRRQSSRLARCTTDRAVQGSPGSMAWRPGRVRASGRFRERRLAPARRHVERGALGSPHDPGRTPSSTGHPGAAEPSGPCTRSVRRSLWPSRPPGGRTMARPRSLASTRRSVRVSCATPRIPKIPSARLKSRPRGPARGPRSATANGYRCCQRGLLLGSGRRDDGEGRSGGGARRVALHHLANHSHRCVGVASDEQGQLDIAGPRPHLPHLENRGAPSHRLGWLAAVEPGALAHPLRRLDDRVVLRARPHRDPDASLHRR